VTLSTALYKWGVCICLLCATLILSDIRQTTAKTQYTPTSSNGQNSQQLKRKTPTTPTPTTSPVVKAKRQMTNTSSSTPSNPQNPNQTLPTRINGRQLRTTLWKFSQFLPGVFGPGACLYRVIGGGWIVR